ncbi:MAG: DUF4863 family protein [Rhodovibrionaceae bacterium]
MQIEEFRDLIGGITAKIAGKPIDATLMAEMNRDFPAGGAAFQQLAEACRSGIAAGWLCQREHGGVKFGRAVKPGAETHGFSVDVVEMDDVAGPHHAHPNGEVVMIVPESEGAVFDGHGEGWLVYEPGTAHSPTVSKGKAIVLYMLPEGAIEFSR